MSQRISYMVSAVVLVFVQVSCSDERSVCSSYCDTVERCSEEECEGYWYYYYDSVEECSWDIDRKKNCILNCRDMSDEGHSEEYVECVMECRHETDCDDFDDCRGDCYWQNLT